MPTNYRRISVILVALLFVILSQSFSFFIYSMDGDHQLGNDNIDIDDLTQNQLIALQPVPIQMNADPTTIDGLLPWDLLISVPVSEQIVIQGIEVDIAGNAYLVGSFSGTAIFGSISLTSEGSYDIFIAKLDNHGSWHWAIRAGGLDYDYGFGITLGLIWDSWEVGIDDFEDLESPAIFITGSFSDRANFGSTTLTSRPDDTPSEGDDDIFVAKINSNGGWEWAKSAGGGGNDQAKSIVMGRDSYLYIAGSFDYYSYNSEPAEFGSTSISSSGWTDIFVAKISTTGMWQWAIKAGGKYSDSAIGLEVDGGGSVYVTGYFRDTVRFEDRPPCCAKSLDSSGGSDIFLAHVGGDGSWEWVLQAGGPGADSGIMIADHGSAVIGYSSDTALFGSSTLSTNSSTQFIANQELDWENDVRRWTSAEHFLFDSNITMMGISHESDYSSKRLVSANAFTGVTIYGGIYSESVTFGSTKLTSVGDFDVFVAQWRDEGYQQDGYWMSARSAGGNNDDILSIGGSGWYSSNGMAQDVSGNIYIAGTFNGSISFGNRSTSSNNQVALFVARIGNDTDGDGLADIYDEFPSDSSEWVDTDNDGIGNNADEDDDGDGYSDGKDEFPLDSSEWIDLDQDGIGDNDDIDDDNDGVYDWNDPDHPSYLSAQMTFHGGIIVLISCGSIILIIIVIAIILRKKNAHSMITTSDAAPMIGNPPPETSQRYMPQTVIGAPSTVAFENLGSGTPQPQAPPPVIQCPPPPVSLTGMISADGYEWLEYGGGKWYRLAYSGGLWNRLQ